MRNGDLLKVTWLKTDRRRSLYCSLNLWSSQSWRQLWNSEMPTPRSRFEALYFIC